MRAEVTCLLATGRLPNAPTIPPDGEQERLSCAAFDIFNTDGTTDESNLAPTIAPVVTRKGKQRILHHPPTPQESRQPPLTVLPGAMPPPTPVVPPPRTRTRKQKDQGTPTVATRKGKQRMLQYPPTPQESRQPAPTAPPEATPPPTPVALPPRTRTKKQRDQGTPEPMFSTQETATSAETCCQLASSNLRSSRNGYPRHGSEV